MYLSEGTASKLQMDQARAALYRDHVDCTCQYDGWLYPYLDRTEITCLEDAIRLQRTHTEYRSPIGENNIGRNLVSGCAKQFQPIRGSRGRQSGTFQHHHSKII